MQKKGIVLDMATTKTNQELKKEKKLAKRAKIDKATNRFMVNLVWGIVLIIALLYMQNMLLINPGAMKAPAIIFAVAAVVLFVCGKIGVIKNKGRAYDYSVFTAVLTVGSLIIAYYTKIRLVVGTSLDSRWWITWAPVSLIIAYLVFAFIWTAIIVARVEKNK